MNILWIRMQNAHKFLKIKFGTSKAFHGWLWQIQAFPSDSWERVLLRLSCYLSYFCGKVWEAWNQSYVPSPLTEITKMVVKMVEMLNLSWILQGTDYVLLVFDSAVHHPSPHMRDMPASHVSHSPTDYQPLCIRNLGTPHLLMETSMADTRESHNLMRDIGMETK